MKWIIQISWNLQGLCLLIILFSFLSDYMHVSSEEKNKYNVWKNKKIQNSYKFKEYESKIFHSQTCSKSIFHCALINVILSEIANIELNFVSLIIIICLMRTFSSCKQYQHAKMSVFTVLWNIFWPVL